MVVPFCRNFNEVGVLGTRGRLGPASRSKAAWAALGEATAEARGEAWLDPNEFALEFGTTSPASPAAESNLLPGF